VGLPYIDWPFPFGQVLPFLFFDQVKKSIIMKSRFIIKKRKDGEFMFNLVAKNGEIIATSEGYKSKQGCLKGIESVRVNAAGAVIEDQTKQAP